MTITQAIRNAEKLLPGIPAPEGKNDPRWQAIMKIEDHIQNHPDKVWDFARKWGTHPNTDLRTAIAVLLIEHLIQCHFERIFPKVEVACSQSRRFCDTFLRCWPLGQAEMPTNAKRFNALVKSIMKKTSQQLGGAYPPPAARLLRGKSRASGSGSAHP
jgi:hypothetical protein